ncbi:MAG: ParB/RepB/Spo0J family partition protein [Gammaproteobacteria bacterium]|nr:ParB/RepB/Spo0J family partition protein [Gammaproteobacteria bacterium]
MSKKPRLGRGLDALLGGDFDDSENAANDGEDNGASKAETLRQLPVDMLQRGRYQPRTHMRQEALEDLAESIRTQGVVQPIVVRELATGSYEIIAGERRWRAAQLAGLDTIPAVIKDIPEEAVAAVALIENIQRENLNPIEEANAFQRLIEEFGMTHQQVAESVGRSRTGVTNLLRLLGLPDVVRQMIDNGDLDMGHARALLALPDTAQPGAAREVVEKDLSVRETERLVKQILAGGGTSKPKPAAVVDPDIRHLEENLSDTLGAKVRIQHKKNGKGVLSIEYNSNDELEGILVRIR